MKKRIFQLLAWFFLLASLVAGASVVYIYSCLKVINTGGVLGVIETLGLAFIFFLKALSAGPEERG